MNIGLFVLLFLGAFFTISLIMYIIDVIILKTKLGYIPAEWKREDKICFWEDCTILHNGLPESSVIDEGDRDLDFELILPWWGNLIF